MAKNMQEGYENRKKKNLKQKVKVKNKFKTNKEEETF